MFLRSVHYIQSGRETKSSTEGSVNQVGGLWTILEEDYISDTSSKSNMSTKTQGNDSSRMNGAGTSLRLSMFLKFYKKNQWGAEIYLDTLDNYVVRVDDQNEDYKPKTLVNCQETDM